MQSKKPLIVLWLAVALVFGSLTITTPLFAASSEQVLYSFAGSPDGANPYAGLIIDSGGNLYGTTWYGGSCDDGKAQCGTVFELTPNGNGTWSETVIYEFQGAPDGQTPAAGLIMDGAGNLYGTTLLGGAYNGGTVFELTPGGNGTWTETVLYSFCPNGNKCPNGDGPYAGLTLDANGNLYGTTTIGGAGCGSLGCGIVFELSPNGSGGWKEKVLHTFKSKNGAMPYAGLIFDTAGNLYGTTYQGGAHGYPGYGTVFKLAPGKNGQWTETVLHSFGSGKDGMGPYAGLVFDGNGNLYGTVRSGGRYNGGAVFELELGDNGKWTEKVLHNFNPNGSQADGEFPYAGLIFDAAGNLYGTTLQSNNNTSGAVFELMPGAKGKWTEKVLHFFDNSGSDGWYTSAGLVLDAAGNLYGTTYYGGANCNGDGCGTVFEVTP